MSTIPKSPENLKKFRTVKNTLHFKGDAVKALSLLQEYENNININWVTSTNSNLLLLAINHCKKDNQLMLLMKYLLDKGIDINHKDQTESQWETAIQSMCSGAEMRRRYKKTPDSNIDLDMIRLLLSHGADVNLTNDNGYNMNTTCLMLCANLPHSLFVEVFEKTTLPIDFQQSESYYDGPLGGWTAAHWAASEKDNTENLQFLLDNGANFLIEEFRDEQSPLVLLYGDNPELFENFLIKNPQLIDHEIERLQKYMPEPHEVLTDYDHRHPSIHTMNAIKSIKEKIAINAQLNLPSIKPSSMLKKVKI